MPHREQRGGEPDERSEEAPSDFWGFGKCSSKENANLARARGIFIVQTRAYYGSILIAPTSSIGHKQNKGT